jgi:hypothetical protein
LFQVVALGLAGPVVRSMAAILDLEDEERLGSSLAELSRLYPRYRGYLAEVGDTIVRARFARKLQPAILVLFSLEDNSFKILH